MMQLQLPFLYRNYFALIPDLTLLQATQGCGAFIFRTRFSSWETRWGSSFVVFSSLWLFCCMLNPRWGARSEM